MNFAEAFKEAVEQVPLRNKGRELINEWFSYTANLAVEYCNTESAEEFSNLVEKRLSLYNETEEEGRRESENESGDDFFTRFRALHPCERDNVSFVKEYKEILLYLTATHLLPHHLFLFVAYLHACDSIRVFFTMLERNQRRLRKIRQRVCRNADDEGEVFSIDDDLSETLRAQFQMFTNFFLRATFSLEEDSVLVQRIIKHCAILQHHPCQPVDVVTEMNSTRDRQYSMFLNQWTATKSLVRVILQANAVHEVAERPEQNVVMDVEESEWETPEGDASERQSHLRTSRPATESSGFRSVVSESLSTSAEHQGEDHEEALSRAEVIEEFKHAKNPSCTKLAELLRSETAAHNLPPIPTDKLLPCVKPEDRTAFMCGFPRLTPWLAEGEITSILHVLMADLTWAHHWLSDDDDDGDGDDGVKTQEGVEASGLIFDTRNGVLTLLVDNAVAHLELTNPLAPALSYSSNGMYQCDSCCLHNIQVAYEAVIYESVRNNFVHDSDCVGYDVCVPCAVFFFKSAFVGLLRAMHPRPDSRVPFNSDTTSRLVIWSLRTHGEDNVVEMLVGVSPLCARPLAWEASLDVEGWSCAVDACSESLSDGSVYVTYDCGLDRHLPIPRGRKEARIVYEGFGAGRLGEDSTCCVCLEPLTMSEKPLFETKCGHLFHRDCIMSVYQLKTFRPVTDESGEQVMSMSSCCPLCREMDFMPPVDDVQYSIRHNVFRIYVPVHYNSAGKSLVGLGGLLSDNGLYYNPTNVSSCCVVEVARGQLLSYDEEPPS